MTEPTPVPVGRQAVATASSGAGDAAEAADSTVEAGLELKVRSQWDYARTPLLPAPAGDGRPGRA